jgi:hypothetical protein
MTGYNIGVRGHEVDLPDKGRWKSLAAGYWLRFIASNIRYHTRKQFLRFNIHEDAADI